MSSFLSAATQNALIVQISHTTVIELQMLDSMAYITRTEYLYHESQANYENIDYLYLASTFASRWAAEGSELDDAASTNKMN